MPIGQSIKIIRKSQKLNQAEFAARIGITQTAISKIELGESNPDTRTLRAIVLEFNVNQEWLLNGSGEMYGIPEKIENKLPSSSDSDFWKELALNQQQIIANLTKSNFTLAESNNTISSSNKIIAETNKKSLETIDTINMKILNLLQSGGVLKAKATIQKE